MIRIESNIIKLALLIFTVGLLTNACVDAYWPDLGNKYDKVLVVDGLITDQPGPYSVKLSQSSQVDDPKYIPLMGYNVQFHDDLGNYEQLAETEPGTYLTDSLGMTGKVGRKYQLVIVAPNGAVYESPFEELRLPTGIDSVYAEVDYQQVGGFDHELPGYQFFVDTHRAEMDTNYFLWRLEGTFKYHANHSLKYTFDGTFHQIGKWDTLYTCWATKKPHEIFTYKTENLTEPTILRLPLHFVSTSTKQLSIRYSLLVKQLSITKSAYDFWTNVKELEAEQETMFTRQPYQIRGNMINRDDPEEPVLGNFMTAGISKKRIFVDRPRGVYFYHKTECNLITEEIGTILWLMREQWPALITTIPAGQGVRMAVPTRKWCIDCQQEYNGGAIVPPDFWIDY